jgi:hypothetical protein
MFNTPESEWPAAIDAWRSLGVSHLSLNTMGAQLESPQAHIDALRRFIELARH